MLAFAAMLPAACSDSEEGADPAGDRAATADDGSDAQGVEEPGDAVPQGTMEGATPNEERVATLGLLNKRNNLTRDIELKPGESREIGPVIVTLASCERTPPWEMPQETGAFVQVDVLERGDSEHTRVFSGWLFKQSPSLNVVEHPIYDVWVKDCAMRFPGEDESAASSDT
jgi:hypothetical protein